MKKQKKGFEVQGESKASGQGRATEVSSVAAPTVVAPVVVVPTVVAPAVVSPAVAVSGVVASGVVASGVVGQAVSAPGLVAGVPSLSAFAVRCQQMYQAARTKHADGCIQLDRERLARALADTGIGSRAEQALYSLAILAAEDGDLALVQDDVIAALRKAS